MEIHILQLFQRLSQVGEETKALLAAAQEGTAPWEQPLQKNSEPILLFFVGFLGAGTQHIDSTTYENLICYICALDCATAQLLIHIFSPQ